jgi:hypothetical protein
MASAFSRSLADQRGGAESLATSCLRLRPMPTACHRPELRRKMRSQRPLCQLHFHSTCQRQLQLFFRPQVLASSTRTVLATTRRSMSASRSAPRSIASVLIWPDTRIELVAARCTSARCCLLLLTDGLLMTFLASLIDSLIAPLIPLLVSSPLTSPMTSPMASK